LVNYRQILFGCQIGWDKVFVASYLVERDIHVFSKYEQSSVGCVESGSHCKLAQ